MINGIMMVKHDKTNECLKSSIEDVKDMHSKIFGSVSMSF